MKKFLRIIYILIFAIASILTLLNHSNTETNILNAVFSNSNADKTVVELSGKYSSKINLIAESDDPDNAAQAINEFLEKTDKKIFSPQEFDIAKILETYKKYHNNFLSAKAEEQLENDKYEELIGESFANLYNPLGINLLPLNEDPFMLFTDYIKSLSNGTEDYSAISRDGKFYNIVQLEINHDYALSPTIQNKEIKKLVKLQKKLSKKDVKIYLTGAPIHSYYASSRSMTEINIICILSAIFIFGLFKLYFANLKLIIPTALSLGAGILSGYMACSFVFPSIHVLTFVFSTTLIGICIDYSLHYFIAKDLSKIFKSLTVSMLTTVSAFAVLMFSGVELLRQIAVFTMTGLFNVYLIVILFYPMLNFTTKDISINPHLPKKFKKIILYTLILTGFCGMFFIKFNDDIRNLYVPSKKLQHAEKLFNEITNGGKQTTFALVKGENFQNMLEKEENLLKTLKGSDYQAISKFVPSHKQQEQNQKLIKKLYNHSLKNYASFLSENEINNLLNQEFKPDYIDMNENELLSEFLADTNTSIIVLKDFNNPEIITERGFQYIDVRRNISDKIKQCRKNCLFILLPILSILFILLSVIYKPKTAAKILLPSIIACLFSIGFLSIFHVEINLFHILAIFLIIGFGLDYSIFRAGAGVNGINVEGGNVVGANWVGRNPIIEKNVHDEKFSEDGSRINSGKNASYGCIKNYNDAVLLSVLTTIFSFLMLSFTNFKLISSLGIILTIGLSVSYITSLIFDYNSEKKQ